MRVTGEVVVEFPSVGRLETALGMAEPKRSKR